MSYALIIGAGVAVALIVGSFMTGRNYEAKINKVEDLKMEIAILKRDKKIAEDALVKAEQDAVELKADDEADQLKIKELQDELDKRGDGDKKCLATDSDYDDWLCKLGVTKFCKPRSPSEAEIRN